MAAWLVRCHSCCTIDEELVEYPVTQIAYWREVLKPVVVVVKLLTERSQTFSGSEVVFGSPRNGNYMGVFEPIA